MGIVCRIHSIQDDAFNKTTDIIIIIIIITSIGC